MDSWETLVPGQARWVNIDTFIYLVYSMLQRIAAVVITLAGVALAIVVGFWVLVILGAFALMATIVYFVRAHVLNNMGSRRERGDRSGNVIEGEYTVVDEDKKHDDEH